MACAFENRDITIYKVNSGKDENILLIGFMGTGKSTVGRLIASKLGFQFVDTDQLIIQKNGTEIPEIFREHGEEYFRDQETEVLESLKPQGKMVISTGGGIVLRESNVQWLKKLGFVALLTASEEVIFERISRNTKRPLLQSDNPRETLAKLLAHRAPLYIAAAQFVIDTSSRSHSEVADAVMKEVERFYSS